MWGGRHVHPQRWGWGVRAVSSLVFFNGCGGVYWGWGGGRQNCSNSFKKYVGDGWSGGLMEGVGIDVGRGGASEL